LVYLKVLLDYNISFQIGAKIAKSIKVSWIKKARENDTISYTREAKRPIALYNMFVDENPDIISSNVKNAIVFFAKNNAIYIRRYSTFKTIIVPLYDHKGNTYDLVEIDDSHIEHIKSVLEHVKTPVGDIILEYHTMAPESRGTKYKRGIYNFSKRKIIYEVKNNKTLLVGYPLANSVTVILETSRDRSTIYIHVLNLLSGDKYEVSYFIKDYLMALVKDYVSSALSSVQDEEHKRQAYNLIEELFIGSPTISEKIDILRVHNNIYVPDVTLDKVVFYKSFVAHIDIEYKIGSEGNSLKIYNTLVLHCSLEYDELSITLKTHEEAYLITKSTNVRINIPSQALLKDKYRVKLYGDFANSRLYKVRDLFDDYLIIIARIWKLNSNNHDKARDSSNIGTLIDILNFSGLDIYEVSINGSKRLFLRFKAKSLEELCKTRRYVLHNSNKEIKILNLSRLCNVLTKSQHEPFAHTKQHIDVTEHVINIDVSPLPDPSQIHGACKGLVHKHKIYLNNIDNNLYLFLSLINYDPSTKDFTVCIPIYKYELSAHKGKWVNVINLGPYTYSSRDTYGSRKIPKSKLIPLIINDIVKNGYNILAYSDILVNVIEEENETDNVFLSTDNIKFKFKDSHIEITDIIYNRRIVFADNAYDQSRLSSHIKQEDKVVVCLDHPDYTKMVYKPFVLSEMELIKSIL
jgi:hypothetical protein